MDRGTTIEEAEAGGVRLLPAGLVGFLVYPAVLELIVAHPPANDQVAPPAQG
ncbi:MULTISPECIES: hypothetical protein [Alphaproteobacteria]|jgi:hypothetical protein|uniref:hypothetical protein n=1 Tax=Alphaproteobacteria TaxID=28211 RepID=UPI002719D7CC|nr:MULTISPECIES: hypothetical protein [Alphaproteobacteria]MDO9501717.1 hypothetical protein [Falsiroseomonas sp.]MDP3342108.1 hypothetical protein [Frigidibacter sp.]